MVPTLSDGFILVQSSSPLLLLRPTGQGLPDRLCFLIDSELFYLGYKCPTLVFPISADLDPWGQSLGYLKPRINTWELVSVSGSPDHNFVNDLDSGQVLGPLRGPVDPKGGTFQFT